MLEKIKTAAGNFIKRGNKLWADRLLDYLDEADLDTRSILYREVASHGYNSTAVIAMKRELADLFCPSIYPDESLPIAGAVSRASMDRIVAFVTGAFSVVRVLANIEVNVLVPASGRWPDPALANLVAGLEPTWRRVTGRTAALISKEKGCLTQCAYADWLGELLEKIGLPGPPVGLVVEVVRPRKQKTEKSRIRHSPERFA